jgi:fructose-1,6-bisphosphatase I
MTPASTLTMHLSAWAQDLPRSRAIAETISAIADVGIRVSQLIGSAPLADPSGATLGDRGADTARHELEIRVQDMLLAGLRTAPVAAVASKELAQPVELDPRGALLVAMDPLDGAANIDTNVSAGTIFSILRAPTEGSHCDADALLQTGTLQVAAGYVIYGPQTAIALTVGAGTHVFTLDRASGSFHLTSQHVRVPANTQEFAINASNHRYWDEPIRIYVDDCLKGAEGPRGADFNMRWTASMVAEAHRVLFRGGIYLYPADVRNGHRQGRLRLIYQANPVAWLVEQAGGAASTGFRRILDVQPRSLDQRVPLLFGSREEVARLERYHVDPHSIGQRSPLFGHRGLFRN